MTLSDFEGTFPTYIAQNIGRAASLRYLSYLFWKDEMLKRVKERVVVLVSLQRR